MIYVDAKYNRSKRVDISKFNHRFAAPAPEAGERPAGEFPVGKDPALDLRDREMSSVAYYVRDINGNWQRCVDAFINVGRLCAEANARLTAAEKSELMQSLPFGEATFSICGSGPTPAYMRPIFNACYQYIIPRPITSVCSLTRS